MPGSSKDLTYLQADLLSIGNYYIPGNTIVQA